MSQQPTFFEQLGGEAGVRRIVERFYDVMDTDPRARGIRELHAADLSEAREKLYLFLCGWSGGPPLYIEKYGHPMLRARHLPFPIGESERDQWIYCMVRALSDVGVEENVIKQFAGALWGVADFMRNRAPDAGQ